jgi:hypothetical protein
MLAGKRERKWHVGDLDVKIYLKEEWAVVVV